MLRQLLLAGLILTPPLARAQNVFVSVTDGKAEIVKQIQRGAPMVERSGALVNGGGSHYGFARATVYEPGLVSFDPNFVIRVVHHEFAQQVDTFAFELRAEGHVTSDTTHRHCFIVMEEVAPTEKGLAFAEIPDLVAGESLLLNVIFPLKGAPELSNYRVHIFSNGVELLHSKMPPPYLATQKQKTTDLLSGKVKDFPAVLTRHRDPPYPETLKATGGTAVIRCHVNKTGDITSVALVSASAPAFGDAALAAVPKWKFDPAIKGLQFIESDVEIPVDFPPLKKS